MKRVRITHEFVEFVPEQPSDGVLYVSITYATAVHRCCCGCGYEVVTPLTPADWTLSFDGETVSLWPSVGNWGLPCQSHYWITTDRVRWAARWSSAQIEAAHASDGALRDRVYAQDSVAEYPHAQSVEARVNGYLRRSLERLRLRLRLHARRD